MPAPHEAVCTPNEAVPLPTHFAPAERADAAGIAEAVRCIEAHPHVQVMLEAFPEAAVILNDERQIVACNDAFLGVLEAESSERVIGRRVGEALGCVHASETPGGCGTTEACMVCGAVHAMLASRRQGVHARQECRVLIPRGTGALELDVVAAPLPIDDRVFTVLSVANAGERQRRAALERVFLHDAVNVVDSIGASASALARGDMTNAAAGGRRIAKMSAHLIEQIRAHRDLLAAERGELQTHKASIPVTDVIESLRATYEYHPLAQGRTIVFAPPPEEGLCLHTDAALLQRVLGNLTRNALEASTIGQRVTIACERVDEALRFTVHNESFMPRAVQLQVFQPSFSTKGGTGRGLGTFGARLLTERYLDGRIEFESSREAGTTFRVTLPLSTTPARTGGAAAPAAEPSADGLLHGLRVLLAEDDADLRELTAFVLRRNGATVATAGDGREAVGWALGAQDTGEPFDLILMDIHMPNTNGLEATRALRSGGYIGRIVAMTASDSPADHAACTEAGCDGHIAKPIDRTTLPARLALFTQSGTDLRRPPAPCRACGAPQLTPRTPPV